MKWGVNWVVEGDFNMVLKRSERSGDQFSVVEEFKNNIKGLNLMDLPLSGGCWTWSKDRSNPSFSRVDIFLCMQISLFNS